VIYESGWRYTMRVVWITSDRVGIQTLDIWQAVKPARLGLAGWPEVPRTVEWKDGICAALGLPHRDQADLAAAWRMILDQVRPGTTWSARCLPWSSS
jgi:Protein of unknown function (DUF3097)